MYYQIYPFIPMSMGPVDCSDLRFWVGFFAIDCFIESFCVLWMAMGGYVDDKFWFTFGWFLHLIVALPYCVSTVAILSPCTVTMARFAARAWVPTATRSRPSTGPTAPCSWSMS